MRLRHLFLNGALLLAVAAFGQQEKPSALTDTSIYDYDELFSELDALLDSIYTPRSFFVAQLSSGKNFFQYQTQNDTVQTKAQLVFTPTLGYYHQSGFGVAATVSFIAGGSGNPWQYSLTGSYDYLQKRDFVAGVSFTKYFIKNELPFYTSPLHDEAFGYITYRKHWLKPSLHVSYGWGDRSTVQQQTTLIDEIKKRRINLRNRNENGNGNNNGGTGTTTVNSYEKIVDFNLQFSVRHDFYFLHLFSKRDYARLTPQLSFSAGSQQFGFNSVVNTTYTAKRNSNISITTTRNITLDEKLAFRPLSLTTQLRMEYSIGKFFVQPQLFFDYYFPAQRYPFTTTLIVSTGVFF